MITAIASVQGTGVTNDDWIIASPDAVIVLDGLSSPADLGTGCIHGVPWFVRRLGSYLLAYLMDPLSLDEALAEALRTVAAIHRHTCDLSHPGTPSSTIAILRKRHSDLDYLVLSDAVLVLDGVAGPPQVVTDDRVEHVASQQLAATRKYPTGSPEHRERVLELVAAQRQLRNQPGGYWVAASEPDAAAHAVVGTVAHDALRRAALMTDGASRYVDVFGLGTWTKALNTLEHVGPNAFIQRVREVEEADPEGRRWPRFKRSDDATIAYIEVAR